MKNSENKKSFEELSDEALDQVAGGNRLAPLCPICGQRKTLDRYHDPENVRATLTMCADCARDIGYVK